MLLISLVDIQLWLDCLQILNLQIDVTSMKQNIHHKNQQDLFTNKWNSIPRPLTKRVSEATALYYTPYKHEWPRSFFSTQVRFTKLKLNKNKAPKTVTWHAEMIIYECIQCQRVSLDAAPDRGLQLQIPTACVTSLNNSRLKDYFVHI